MKWKNILKIFAISFSAIVIVLAGLLVWGLSKLPSAFQIKQSLTPPALRSTAVKTGTLTPPPKTAALPAHTSETSMAENSPAPPISEKEQLAEDTSKAIFNDLIDTRRPLVESCRNLSLAPESKLLSDPENASAKYFFKSLAQEQHDPLVETAAPILRYIFRAPGMQTVVDMIMKAEEQKDLSLLKKAEFYYELYRSGEFLKGHKDDMDVILQKTYNMHHLAKAVAQKPELAKEPSTLTFCEQMEKNVNEAGAYNADEAASEMMSFLNSAGITAKSIGYDPHYRSKVKLNLSSTQVMINDTWVVQMFARDITKAQKKPGPKRN